MTIKQIQNANNNFKELYNQFVSNYYEISDEDLTENDKQMLKNQLDYLWDIAMRISSAMYSFLEKNLNDIEALKAARIEHSILHGIQDKVNEWCQKFRVYSKAEALKSDVAKFKNVLKKSMRKIKQKSFIDYFIESSK